MMNAFLCSKHFTGLPPLFDMYNSVQDLCIVALFGLEFNGLRASFHFVEAVD
jgi:hypothetical protein